MLTERWYRVIYQRPRPRPKSKFFAFCFILQYGKVNETTIIIIVKLYWTKVEIYYVYKILILVYI